MSSPPALLPVDATDLPGLVAALGRALAGGPAVIPYAATPLPLPVHDPASLPEGLALVVGTSGSTGTPKPALLTAAALRASAAATHEALGGVGRWLLALPAAHIAGVQVLVRAQLSGAPATVMDRSGGFTAEAFVRAAAALAACPGPRRRYTAMVPTQIARLLADEAATAALAGFDAVLAGGAALPAAVRRHAAAAGVHLVATYGMSETAGGCVYDGRPLRGTRVALEDDCRIRLAGPTLAAGYLGAAPGGEDFVTVAGERWFRTDDLGEFAPDGRLRVVGRRDDIVVTGGVKVHPRLVEEAALAHLPGVTDALAVGIPDPHWGQALVLALVASPDALLSQGPPGAPGRGAPTPLGGPSRLGALGTPEPVATNDARVTAWAREGLRGVLAAYALPHRVLVLDALPQRGPGKPDRAAVAALATQDVVGQ